MGILRFFSLLILLALFGCKEPQPAITVEPDNLSAMNSFAQDMELAGKAGNCALLLTRFKSLPELKSVVQITYDKARPFPAHAKSRKPQVNLTHRSGGREVTSILKTGISETDFMRARDGNYWDKIALGLRCPFAVINRRALMNIERLGRRRPWIYGKGDVAFYDLAETMVFNISDEDTMSMSPQDLSEKGYLNTFNHVTAQAFMTSIYTEALADFIADVHERKRMPELITGFFAEEQLADLENGPVDNYLDLINNEWGQELGKTLRIQYGINRFKYWTPQLMADYLNDIQNYHSWAFQIGFKPFRPKDDVVIRFATKINSVLEVKPK